MESVRVLFSNLKCFVSICYKRARFEIFVKMANQTEGFLSFPLNLCRQKKKYYLKLAATFTFQRLQFITYSLSFRHLTLYILNC